MEPSIRRIVDGSSVPESGEAFGAMLRRGGIDLSLERDPWGNPLRIERRRTDSKSERTRTITFQEFQKPPETRTFRQAITQTFADFTISSAGPDKKADTADDINFLSLHLLEKEDPPSATANANKPDTLPMGNARIDGTVRDPHSVGIGSGILTLVHPNGQTRTAVCGESGHFVFDAIPPGTYQISIERFGFRAYELVQIPAVATRNTELEIFLELEPQK